MKSCDVWRANELVGKVEVIDEQLERLEQTKKPAHRGYSSTGILGWRGIEIRVSETEPEHAQVFDTFKGLLVAQRARAVAELQALGVTVPEAKPPKPEPSEDEIKGVIDEVDA